MRLLIFLLLAGCVMEPQRQYNTDDEQDGMCYATYGGEWGYCDKPHMVDKAKE